MLEPTEIDGQTHNLIVPMHASAIIYAEMYYRGESFEFEDFEYLFEPSPAEISLGEAFFTAGYVAIDTDANGELEAHERFDIVGGTVSFLGLLPDLELSFSVALANGQTGVGYYTGLFDFADRRPLAPGIVSEQSAQVDAPLGG